MNPSTFVRLSSNTGRMSQTKSTDSARKPVANGKKFRFRLSLESRVRPDDKRQEALQARKFIR